MVIFRYAALLITIFILSSPQCSGQVNNSITDMQKKNTPPPLTPIEAQVIEGKGTQVPFTGKYDDFYEPGTYHCRKCGAPLYRSSDKFDGHCGWPAFDDEIDGAVKRTPDADGIRTEIECARCGAHLGHVFTGEGFTSKDTRHCVNSISMIFVPDMKEPEAGQLQTAVFASGCFWGTEYWFSKIPGVVSTEPGYAGGWLKNPSYKEVCSGQTGHLECVRVVYDPVKVSYEQLLRTYFNTHDPQQQDGQGPDIGPQYLSAVFYTTEEQKKALIGILDKLRKKGIIPATQVRPLDVFYPEKEDYHKKYYEKTGNTPYCHIYKEII